MDRNVVWTTTARSCTPVATREGGVDRNNENLAGLTAADTSPPARVAWIETTASWRQSLTNVVATREGGVDRNLFKGFCTGLVTRWSPPARVAWIETTLSISAAVALSASPPARVAWIETPLRNLKNKAKESPPARVAWIET